ncbi:MAG: DUF4424 family protein, partial [Pseudomonadota bacterium]
PIGRFVLRIKTTPPDEFMSVCFPGKLRMVSPGMYECVHADFVPQDRLIVYFYTVETGGDH